MGKLTLILPLGGMPLVNNFPKRSELKKEKKYPLDFCICKRCGLAQVGLTVPRQRIFRTYHYMTSSSQPWVLHLAQLARHCIQKYRLTKEHKVLDIGSNDGTFLSFFVQKGIPVVGVEPSTTISEFARKKGVPTKSAFFTSNFAHNLVSEHGTFDLITILHVLANIPDLADFFTGVHLTLKANGIVIMEVDSLSAMLRQGRFDSIYHEHYSYFSVGSLATILQASGFKIVEVTRIPSQGESLRVTAAKAQGSLTPRIAKLEDDLTLGDFKQFPNNVRAFQKALRDLFRNLAGKTVVGFGAPAKAVTLLNYSGLGPDVISFIVDATPLKQGRYLPGVNIPIYKEEYLKGKPVDAVLVLAWNYRDQIVGKIRKFTPKGTKIIIPFPKLEVISL